MNERTDLTMTSRIGQKAAGVAAIIAIILLVILIVLLWTGVGVGVFNSKNSSVKHHHPKSHRMEDMNTLLSELDIVTSSATLLNDKMDDYMRGNGKSNLYYFIWCSQYFLRGKEIMDNIFSSLF